VELCTLGGLVGVVNGRTNGNGGCGSGVRAAQVECHALKVVWRHVVLIQDGNVARRTLGTLKILMRNEVDIIGVRMVLDNRPWENIPKPRGMRAIGEEATMMTLIRG
jgi:hypothetical protein